LFALNLSFINKKGNSRQEHEAFSSPTHIVHLIPVAQLLKVIEGSFPGRKMPGK
jgi:hypothetical protein